MNRRDVLRGSMALATTSHTAVAVAVAEMPDRNLLDLGRAFDEAYAAEEAERAVCRKTGNWSSWDAAYARTESIVDLIEKEPATTMEGLCIKARCIKWCYGDDPVDLALNGTTDVLLATQIVKALLHGGIGA